METTGNVELVILAAGESSRFQGIKVLACIDGKTILQRAIDTCRVLQVTPLTVVLGAHINAIESTIDFAGIKKCVNADWREGMAASIRCAVTGAADTTDALLVLAADQVRLESVHLQDMISLWRQNPGKIIAASYSGQSGIPVLFPRTFWPSLLVLEGDCGARQVLRDFGQDVILYPLPEAKVDIDTRDELASLGSSPLFTGIQ